MATFGKQDFTGFIGLNIVGSTAIRFAADVVGNESTLSVRPSLDTARAWTFPDKSGTIPITGTFSVDLPVIASSGYLQTVVTVSGIRTEDALNVSPQNQIGGAAVLSARGAAFVYEALPGNGTITMTLVNAFATATIARTSIFSYTTAR